MLKLNACGILEKTSHIESSKEIGPLPERLKYVVCQGVVGDQRIDLVTDWPLNRFIGNKAHGADWTFFLEDDRTQPTCII